MLYAIQNKDDIGFSRYFVIGFITTQINQDYEIIASIHTSTWDHIVNS